MQSGSEVPILESRVLPARYEAAMAISFQRPHEEEVVSFGVFFCSRHVINGSNVEFKKCG
jgi:hypothetical protein